MQKPSPQKSDELPEAEDKFKTERETILDIFDTARKSKYTPAETGEVMYAFNKAADFIEHTPGIVEYFSWKRQKNAVVATDGTDFRGALHSVAREASYYPARVRAIEALGNISTRHFDYVRTYYDVEMLVPLIAKAPNEDITGATLTALRKIAMAPDRKQVTVPMHQLQFYNELAAHAGGQVDYRSHYNPKQTIDPRADITYLEVVIGLSAHVLNTSGLPKARLYAAENLREIADGLPLVRDTSAESYRSLVRQIVGEIVPNEKDPKVLSVLQNIFGADELARSIKLSTSVRAQADTLKPR